MTLQKIALIGPNGCGKSTLAHALSSLLHVPILGVGDVIRNRADYPWVEPIIGDYDIASGTLLSSDQVQAIMTRYLEIKGSDGWVLDGIPRKVRQLDWMYESPVQTPSVFIIFESSLEVILRRLSQTERLIHRASGRVYNSTTNPPKKAGVDDITGDVLEVRTDDASATLVTARYSTYQEYTIPTVKQILSDCKTPTIIIHDTADMTTTDLQRAAAMISVHVNAFCGQPAGHDQRLSGTITAGRIRMSLNLF